MLIDCITYRTDGSVMIGERVIGEGNREGMKGDYVSLVIEVGNESSGSGCVYYYLNNEIQPVGIGAIPSVVYFSLSLSSHSSIQFISHDIHDDTFLKTAESEVSHDESELLLNRSIAPNETTSSSTFSSLSSSFYSFSSLVTSSSSSSSSLSYSFSSSSTLPSSSTSSLSSSSSPISPTQSQLHQTSNSPSSSSLSSPQSQQYPTCKYPLLSFLHTKYSHNKDAPTPSSTDYYSISSYNIPDRLCGIGEDILNDIIHECSDSRDVIALLVASGRISKVILSPGFEWAVSHCSSLTYSLRDVPCDKVDVV